MADTPPPSLNDLMYAFYGGTGENGTFNDVLYAALLEAYNNGINVYTLLMGGGAGGRVPTYYQGFDPTTGGAAIQEVFLEDADGGEITLGVGAIHVGPMAFDADQETTQAAFDSALGAGVVTIGDTLPDMVVNWVDIGPVAAMTVVTSTITPNAPVINVILPGTAPIDPDDIAIGATWEDNGHDPLTLYSWGTDGTDPPEWGVLAQMNA